MARRNYRIARVTILGNPKQQVNLYQRIPDLRFAPYEEQQRILFGQFFTYTDGFSRAMRAIGHDAHDLIADCEPMQRAWAAQCGVCADSARWRDDILLAQLLAIKPDVVLFQDIHCASAMLRRNLKLLCPFIKLSIVHKGFPGPAEELHGFDSVFVASPLLQDYYRRFNVTTHLLYHCFNTSVLELLPKAAALRDIDDCAFLGSSGYNYGAGHRSRYWMLARLIRNTPLKVWLDENLAQSDLDWHALRTFCSQELERSAPEQIIAALMGQVIHSEGEKDMVMHEIIRLHEMRQKVAQIASHPMPHPELLGDPLCPLAYVFPGRVAEAVHGLDFYRQMQRSRIIVNRHSNAGEGWVGNMRMFEAAGVGACLLNDNGPNLKDLFEPDREVVTYSGVEDCLEKIRYLLEHEDVCRSIAEAGQRRTLSSHSNLERYKLADEIIQRLL